MGVGQAAAIGGVAGIAACLLVWLLGVAGGNWIKKRVAARRAAVCYGLVRFHGCIFTGLISLPPQSSPMTVLYLTEQR